MAVFATKRLEAFQNGFRGWRSRRQKKSFRRVTMTYQTASDTDETAISILQPDVLLPIQYFESVHRKSRLDPEQRLMLAILEDAIACFQKYVFAQRRRGRTLFAEAEQWFAESDSDYIFSFENICEVLGLNGEYLRQGLQRWKQRELTKYHNVKVMERSSIHRRTGKMKYEKRNTEAREIDQGKKAVGFR
jgi:hypothetical protein